MPTDLETQLATLHAHVHACVEVELDIVSRHYAMEPGLMDGRAGGEKSAYRKALSATVDAKDAYCWLKATGDVKALEGAQLERVVRILSGQPALPADAE